MKFSLSRETFAQTVSWVARTVPSRPAQPVLAGIKIDADASGELTFTAFDFETSARATVDEGVEVDTAGSVVVSGKMLNDIANALTAGTVTVALDGSKVLIKCGSAKFTLFSMPLEDYPKVTEFPAVVGTIDSGAFAHAVKQVEVAASKDDTVPLLTNIKVVSDGDKLTLLSTDRYRLAKGQLAWQSQGREIDVLIRAKALSGAARSVAGAPKVTIAAAEDGSVVGFESGGRRITSLVTAGDYPAVDRLFPENAELGAVVNVAALRDAVKRVSLVAERNEAVRITFNPDNTLTLTAGAGDQAAASESIEAKVITDGEAYLVAFNPIYLSEGLGSFSSEFVRFEITHPTKPVLMTGVDAESQTDETYRYLIVPIRTAR